MAKFEKEYEVLRHELDGNRKYVFERPLVIITAAFLLFGFKADSEIIMLFPVMIIYLLLFNLKFTSNRLDSSARIVSYIRLVIEQNDKENYQWETLLSKYREIKDGDKGLRYYPIIFWFHILTAIFFILIEMILFLRKCKDFKCFSDFDNPTTLVSMTLSLIGLVFIIYFGVKTSPKRAKKFFDNEINYVNKSIKALRDDELKKPKQL